MKKNKILFTSLFAILGSAAVTTICTSSFAAISNIENNDNSQDLTPLTAKTAAVRFQARSTQTDVTFVGATAVKATVGKPFATIPQPVAYFKQYVFDHWEYEDGSTVKDTDPIPASGITVYPYFEQDIELKHCVGLQALHDSTVSLITHGLDQKDAPDVKWSKDGVTWEPYKLGEIKTIKSGEVIYFKGRNAKGFSTSETTYTSFSIGGAVSLTGDVMTLINDGQAEEDPKIPCDHCFYRLFENCSGIVSISSNFLPSVHLKRYCYAYMFENCHNLTDFPSTLLPDTKLDDGDGKYDGWMCYCGMFMNCRGIKAIPEGLLGATTLSTYCYYGMFDGCSSLTTVPNDVLPATNLVYGCYYSMFADCENLDTIGGNLLPATTLAQNCYGYMFANCIKLDDLSSFVLPAGVGGVGALAPNCYDQMFYGCKGLTQAPTLGATTLAPSCYSGMFYNCTSLEADGLPALVAENLTGAEKCYQWMFYGCNSIENLPNNYLPATTLSDYCYSEMFKACNKLGDLSNLSLPAETLAPYCYESMFANSSITKAPSIAATTLANYCCQSMFNTCESLVVGPALVAENAATGCYSSMFVDCKKLTSSGQINLTSLSTYCCYMMFANCVNFEVTQTSGETQTLLWHVPDVTPPDEALTNMFQGTNHQPQQPVTPAQNTDWYFPTPTV